MSTDFISRWSRRKLQTDATPSEPQVHETPAPASQTSETGRADEPAPAEAEQHDGEITAEELAALPSLEELTAASDITGFLRKGIPLALRNRALRRMWAIDPAIRDFVGDARDYAWDWNTPGGVPVSGPLPATMDVKKMVQDIFGRDPAKPAEVRELLAEHEDVIDRPADIEMQESPAPDPVRIAESVDNLDLPQEEEPLDSPQPARPRRHGGALPS